MIRFFKKFTNQSSHSLLSFTLNKERLKSFKFSSLMRIYKINVVDNTYMRFSRSKGTEICILWARRKSNWLVNWELVPRFWRISKEASLFLVGFASWATVVVWILHEWQCKSVSIANKRHDHETANFWERDFFSWILVIFIYRKLNSCE